MRVVFVPLPGVSHAFHMVPLAWGLLAAGHDVTFLTGDEALAVRDAGIPVVDPIPNVRSERAPLRTSVPQVFRPSAHLTAEELVELRTMVLRVWDNQVDAFVDAARRLNPDLIVYDPVFNAGLVAAAVLGVPAVGHGLGPMRHTAQFLRKHAPAAFERHQVELPDRLAMIDIVPEAMAEEVVPANWLMRFVPYNGAGIVPLWTFDPPVRPRVAVTLGKVASGEAADSRLGRVVEAARGIDAEFVLTVDDATAGSLAPLPANVRIAGWVPLSALLRGCAAIIHLGGSGSMLTAAVAGVPQLVVPEGLGYEVNARAVTRYGCGFACAAEDIDVDTVTRLLRDDVIRTAAVRLRTEFERMHSPADLVGELEAFARR
jgi:UDP:flavonoid glycosyltransferase YjiC (YdhE family)